MPNGFKRYGGLAFEVLALLYLLVISLLKFVVEIPLAGLYLVVAVVATILVFGVEVGYFKNYRLMLRGYISMNLLIAIACHVTYLYSLVMLIVKTSKLGFAGIEHEFWETPVALFTLFRIGKIIENRLKNTSMRSRYEIMQLKNQESLLVVGNHHQPVKIDEIKVGDRIYVPRGAMVTVDAKLISPTASLDLSSITGEKDAVNFESGGEISSGSINLGEGFICEAIRIAEESKLGQILQRLEDMMSSPTKTELISQRIIKYFVPSTLLIVTLTFITWLITSYVVGVDNLYYLYMGDRSTSPLGAAIWVATSVLVIACPCAFGIAAPISTYSSSILATDNRILFSEGQVFERLLKVKYAVFDKTGTITESASKVASYLGNREELGVALMLTLTSTHPISKAIAGWLQGEGVKSDELVRSKEITGVGIEGEIRGSHYQLVSKRYSDSKGYPLEVELSISDNYSYTMLVRDGVVVGVFLIEDIIRANSKTTIVALKRLGINCIMLSGDTCKNVERIANYVGMDSFKCQLTPEEKMVEVKRLRGEGDVIYVGDGINDVLATEAASLSISFESGADLTKSLADITIIDNDIFSVYRALLLSRKTVNTIRTNFV